MFSNLSKGSVLYGLDNKNGVKLFTGTVEKTTIPYPRSIQNTFGQLPEMVVDITVNIEGEHKEFKQVPSNNVIADFGPDTIVLSDSKDSLVNYVRSLRQTSKGIIESCTKHQELIPQYDKVLQELNPELVNENAVKELQGQFSDLQTQVEEILLLLKSEKKDSSK